MFDETLIVKSAISAFNNSALVAPAFLWSALLATPLFAIIYFYGDIVLQKLGLKKDILIAWASVLFAGLAMGWIVLFSGNYNVLRDDMTVLPLLIAAIIFVCSLFVTSYTGDFLSAMQSRLRVGKKHLVLLWILVALLIFAVGMPLWYVAALQAGAFLLGGIIGVLMRGKMRPIGGVVLICVATSAAILMQPEFFRFGQLGALTVAHLLGVGAVGVFAMATMALYNFRAHKWLQRSAYIKLKWILRIAFLSALALFALTESVPVFIAMMAAALVSFILSIWHAEKISDALPGKMLAMLFISFGVLTVMPAISVAGILIWIYLPRINVWAESKILL